MIELNAVLACSRLRDSGESAKRKRLGKTRTSWGERWPRPLFPCRSSYFHVCFLILVLSLLSESLEQANAVQEVGEDRNSPPPPPTQAKIFHSHKNDWIELRVKGLTKTPSRQNKKR